MRLSSYKTIFVSILLLSILGGCSYFKSKGNKQDFLDAYRSFMQDVQGNYNIYDSKDWNVADEKIVDFSQNQYRVFEADLTFHEKLEVGKYPILYHLYKYKRTVKDQVNLQYRPDAQKLKESLTEIMDTTANVFNGFDKDIREMLIDFKRKDPDKPGSIVVTPDTVKTPKRIK